VTAPTVESTADAVRRHVRPSDCVYIGNFGAQLFAVGHELIRQRLDRLHAVVASGGLLLDQLIGAGSVEIATFAHCWSPIGPEPAWNFRRAAEQARPPELRELSLGMLSAALQAAAWGVPFMPVALSPETGYARHDWSRGLSRVDTEFGSSHIVRALSPDVAFVHADAVDPLGNAVILGPFGEAVLASQAASKVVIVAEEMKSTQAMRATPACIPGALVTSIVIHPGAVKPDGAAGRYARDVAAYRSYVRESATEEGFRDWLSREVTGRGPS
jgi:glutaconate CoA-transferase, subunit A